MSKTNATDEEQFDWVQFKKDYADTNVETQKEKLVRKFKENPLVPIGIMEEKISILFSLIKTTILSDPILIL